MLIRALMTAAMAAMMMAGASADIVDRGPAGFTVRTSVAVAASAERIYQALLQPGVWWDKAHTYSGDARNMWIAAEPGGCFCEKVPGGGAVEHGRVVNLMPGKLLRLSAALGPLQEMAAIGTLTWQIESTAEEKASKVTMTYAAGGYAPGGLDKLAPVVDTVLSQQLQLVKHYVEK